MFYYLDGTVAEILPYLAVIDCGGVGYACKTTNTTLAQLKRASGGSSTPIWTWGRTPSACTASPRPTS